MTATLADSALAPIGWIFNSGGGGIWLWRTDHFDAVIGKGFFWRVEHHGGSTESRQLLGDGQTRTFEAAEISVRETVGKCYPTQAGYMRYAGALATTFTTADGCRVDFGRYQRKRVLVDVRNGQGTTDVYQGTLTVRHHTLIVERPGAPAVQINPRHVDDIRCADGSIPSPVHDMSANRMHPGKVTPGCTGRAGFRYGLVDHMGAPPCPVHE